MPKLNQSSTSSFFGRSTAEEYKVVDSFDSTYWSGLDMQVRIDNVLIDENIQLNYRVVEQVRPYFGYSDYVAARMHHGSRIITGEISLNFKRFGYLFSLINMIKFGKTKLTIPDQEINTTDAVRALQGTTTASLTAMGLALRGFAGGAASSGFVQTVSQGLASPEAARDFVKAYKNSQLISEDKVNQSSHTIAVNRGMFETSKKGFDLSITFGDRLLSSDQIIKADYDGVYRRNSVPIEQDTLLEGVPGTKLLIKGVSLFSQDKAQGDDGRPLIDTYSFQARDLEVIR